jgi:tetratricopeptide (TPR) repeat protein
LGGPVPHDVPVNKLAIPSSQAGSSTASRTPTLARMEHVLGLLRQSDWNNALEAWDTVAWKPWLDMARELRDLGRRDEADRVLHKLTERFPGQAEPALEHASMAYAEQNWAEAITRFEMFRQRFPDSVVGYRYVGDLLFGQGRFDEADIVIQEGMARFPDEMALAVSYAWSGHLKGDQIGDWGEACKRWRLLVSLFPDNPLGASMLGFVLTRYLGQPQTAEIILSGAIIRFPDDVGCAMQYARAADYQRNWDEAMRRWNAFAARWPDNHAIKEGRGETEARRHFHDIDTLSVASNAPSLTRVAPEADILLKFESLGENCEFGLVQRHYGAEPLGLLRWMGAEPDQLCLALEAGFGRRPRT